jgi:SAM-dependent methyltransferase
MAQREVWENEYRNNQLITGNSEPREDLKRFLKWLRKEQKINITDKRILDLGSGTGRNANYLAGLGNSVVGLEISPTAASIAEKRAKELDLEVDYKLQSIGDKYPFQDSDFDLIIDVMSSNSLSEKERDVYLEEVYRVLKPDGFFFVRALSRDGDKNAKNLLKLNPGPERDTYIIKEMGLVERVFSESDFRTLYSPFFSILKLEKKSNYARFRGQNYKRNYWIAYMQR